MYVIEFEIYVKDKFIEAEDYEKLVNK